MARSGKHKQDMPSDLDALIEEILVDAYGDDEQLWAFCQAFEDSVKMPADAFVIGEPVSVIQIKYDGNTRRGLTAACRKRDGSEHVVALSDIVLPEGSEGAPYLAGYRKWLGLGEVPAAEQKKPKSLRRHKATDKDIELNGPVQLIILNVKQRAARCRITGTEREITLRSSHIGDTAPGEIVTVLPQKQWRYSGHPYLSGKVVSQHIDISALRLRPLRLYDRGMWNPADEYWGEHDEPIPEWANPIIARGPRPLFEMEQIIPGEDPDDPFDDPITRSNDLKMAGELAQARRLLMELLAADLRCLDAHAHLGNLVFDSFARAALRHYKIGIGIGELSLGDDFDGVLLWGLIDNRPFLRCLHGYGLCLWRLEQFNEAEQVFERMLWLNPSDNQGARFLLADIREGKSWEEHCGKW